MIHGVIHFSHAEPSRLLSVFAECKAVAVHHDSALVALDDRMKHLHSNDCGAIVGSNRSRSVFVSHLACKGSGCGCADMAAAFLLEDRVLDRAHVDQMCFDIQERCQYPCMSVLFAGKQVAVLRYFSPEDGVRVHSLAEGSYSIR